MAVHDNDIELLYSYLDGELSIPECEGLWRRLAVESELNGELDRLRADHETRQSAFAMYEPTEQQVSRVVSTVFRKAKRSQIFSLVMRSAQVVSAAAALLLVGFAYGWNKHGQPFLPVAGTANTAVVASATDAQKPSRYAVTVMDDSGRVFALPVSFNSIEDAQRAADDVAKSLHNRQDIGSSNVVQAAQQY